MGITRPPRSFWLTQSSCFAIRIAEAVIRGRYVLGQSMFRGKAAMLDGDVREPESESLAPATRSFCSNAQLFVDPVLFLTKLDSF